MSGILVKLIDFYKKYISKMLVIFFGGGCRYNPTCSEYAKEAIVKYGAVNGSIMAVKRITRCHPFSTHRFFDPVP